MKGVLKNLHRYVTWALVSLFFWAWIFILITDAPAGKKLILYAEVPALERQTLSEALEEAMPDHIRFVEARPFSDELFQPGNLLAGDLFIVPESKAAGYKDTFTPIDPQAFAGEELLYLDGVPYGVYVFDEAAGIRRGASFVSYEPGQKYGLFFQAKSKHLGDWNGSDDDAAIRAARRFLCLP